MGPGKPPSHLQEFLNSGTWPSEICEALLIALPEGLSQGPVLSVNMWLLSYGIRESGPASASRSFGQMRNPCLGVLPPVILMIVNQNQNPVFMALSTIPVNKCFKISAMWPVLGDTLSSFPSLEPHQRDKASLPEFVW